VAKTLLAVDDSVTMRKVLEITFSGEDFRVVSADTTQGALAKLSENPQVCVIDTVLGGEDGYSLAKEVRKRNPAASIIMLASRYAPYDQGRGRDAGADDWADKPFDTQQLIDKVRKVMLAKEAGGGASASGHPYRDVPAAAAAPAAPAAAPARPAAPPTPGGGLGRGTQPSLSGALPRTGTLVFGDNAPGAAAAPVAAPPQVRPIATPATAPQGFPPAAAPSPVAAAVNGQLAGKLGDLGLSAQQADAVLALSREVVERVVWEVVPQLAEALIKEEIARLTKE
jgi:CheY-like chemotaxis protein